MIATAWRLLGSPLAGRIGAAMAVLLGLLAMAQCTAKGAALKQVDRLTAQITEPKTGYAARLAQANTNYSTCRTALSKQTDEVDRVSREGRQRVAQAETALKAARSDVEALERRAAAMLAYQPRGADTCARMEDVRRRYLETLK